jgi:hypothetical protein
LVIIYQLTQLRSKNRGIGKVAFTKEEWDKAVSDYYSAQYQEDAEKRLLGMPGYSLWTPPSYEEVKGNPNALATLRKMTDKK